MDDLILNKGVYSNDQDYLTIKRIGYNKVINKLCNLDLDESLVDDLNLYLISEKVQSLNTSELRKLPISVSSLFMSLDSCENWLSRTVDLTWELLKDDNDFIHKWKDFFNMQALQSTPMDEETQSKYNNLKEEFLKYLLKVIPEIYLKDILNYFKKLKNDIEVNTGDKALKTLLESVYIRHHKDDIRKAYNQLIDKYLTEEYPKYEDFRSKFKEAFEKTTLNEVKQYIKEKSTDTTANKDLNIKEVLICMIKDKEKQEAGEFTELKQQQLIDQNNPEFLYKLLQESTTLETRLEEVLIKAAKYMRGLSLDVSYRRYNSGRPGLCFYIDVPFFDIETYAYSYIVKVRRHFWIGDGLTHNKDIYTKYPDNLSIKEIGFREITSKLWFPNDIHECISNGLKLALLSEKISLVWWGRIERSKFPLNIDNLPLVALPLVYNLCDIDDFEFSSSECKYEEVLQKFSYSAWEVLKDNDQFMLIWNKFIKLEYLKNLDSKVLIDYNNSKQKLINYVLNNITLIVNKNTLDYLENFERDEESDNYKFSTEKKLIDYYVTYDSYFESKLRKAYNLLIRYHTDMKVSKELRKSFKDTLANVTLGELKKYINEKNLDINDENYNLRDILISWDKADKADKVDKADKDNKDNTVNTHKQEEPGCSSMAFGLTLIVIFLILWFITYASKG